MKFFACCGLFLTLVGCGNSGQEGSAMVAHTNVSKWCEQSIFVGTIYRTSRGDHTDINLSTKDGLYLLGVPNNLWQAIDQVAGTGGKVEVCGKLSANEEHVIAMKKMRSL